MICMASGWRESVNVRKWEHLGETEMVAHLCCLGYCFAKYLNLNMMGSDISANTQEIRTVEAE